MPRKRRWKKWLMPTLATITFLANPFQEEIRDAVRHYGVALNERVFDIFLAVALVGLVVALVATNERLTQAAADLRSQLQEDLKSHRHQLKKDLTKHREQVMADLASLLDSKVGSIPDTVGTLQSMVRALDSRMGALESRLTALRDEVKRSTDGA